MHSKHSLKIALAELKKTKHKKSKKKLKLKGVTTFIKDVLMQGKRHIMPKIQILKQAKGQNNLKKKNGLYKGRIVDNDFNCYIKDGKIQNSVVKIIRILKKNNIVPLMPQVPVKIQTLGLKTSIDAVGFKEDTKEIVVIELKNTQMTQRQHKQAYDLVAGSAKILTNGKKNSEKDRHALQAAFGAIALEKILNVKNVKPVVIVNCKDAANYYQVDESFKKYHLFA